MRQDQRLGSGQRRYRDVRTGPFRKEKQLLVSDIGGHQGDGRTHSLRSRLRRHGVTGGVPTVAAFSGPDGLGTFARALESSARTPGGNRSAGSGGLLGRAARLPCLSQNPASVRPIVAARLPRVLWPNAPERLGDFVPDFGRCVDPEPFDARQMPNELARFLHRV